MCSVVIDVGVRRSACYGRPRWQDHHRSWCRGDPVCRRASRGHWARMAAPAHRAIIGPARCCPTVPGVAPARSPASAAGASPVHSQPDGSSRASWPAAGEAARRTMPA